MTEGFSGASRIKGEIIPSAAGRLEMKLASSKREYFTPSSFPGTLPGHSVLPGTPGVEEKAVSPYLASFPQSIRLSLPGYSYSFLVGQKQLYFFKFICACV